MTHIETMQHKGYTIDIYYDEHAESPREWDNLGTMACYHGRYTLGDDKQYEDADALREYLETHADEVYQLPIYIYEHGGITISTSPFGCDWDSGQLGVIYVTKEKAQAEGFKCEERVLNSLEQEVKTYDDFLRGNVYGFKVLDPDGLELDSCWGFVGDMEFCVNEAMAVAEYFDNKTPKQYELDLA